MLWEFWKEELANGDEKFINWLQESGRARMSESGTKLELGL